MSIFDVVVVGAGLSGASIAHVLRDEAQVLVVGETGGQVPGATLHAFPGWSFRRQPVEFEAFEIAARVLRSAPPELVVEAEMHRPLIGRAGKRLGASYDEVHAEIPALISCRRGQGEIIYGPAFGVDLQGVIEWLLQGVERRRGRVRYGWKDRGELVELETEAGETIRARNVVVAPGASLEWYGDLPVEVFGGEVVEFEEWQLPHFVAASGHIGPMPGGRPVAGASFWPVAEPEDANEAATGLIERLMPVVPEIADRPIHQVWTGYRAVSSDRFPIVGRIDERVWISGALGARGLYWAFALAEWLRAAMVGGGAVPIELDVARFDAK